MSDASTSTSTSISNIPTVKVVFVGPSGSGKTATINRIVGNELPFTTSPTPRSMPFFKTVSVDKINSDEKTNVRLFITDTAGDERLLPVSMLSCKDTNVVVHCVSPSEYWREDLIEYLDQARQYAPNATHIIMLTNYTRDQIKFVDYVRSFAKDMKLKFYYTPNYSSVRDDWFEGDDGGMEPGFSEKFPIELARLGLKQQSGSELEQKQNIVIPSSTSTSLVSNSSTESFAPLGEPKEIPWISLILTATAFLAVIIGGVFSLPPFSDSKFASFAPWIMLAGSPFLFIGIILLKHYEWLNSFCCNKKGLSSLFFIAGLAFLADAAWIVAKFSFPSDFGNFSLITSPAGLLLCGLAIVINIAICASQGSCPRGGSQSSSTDVSASGLFSTSDHVSAFRPDLTSSVSVIASTSTAPNIVVTDSYFSSVPTPAFSSSRQEVKV